MGENKSSRDESSVDYVMHVLNYEGVTKQANKSINAKLNDSSFLLKDQYFYDSLKVKWRNANTEEILENRKNMNPPEGDHPNKPDIPPIEEDWNLQLKGARVACMVLGSLVMAISIGLIIFIVVQKKHSVIHMSQPPFLIMICVGTLLMSIAIIFVVLDDSVTSAAVLDVTCSASVWLVSLGFVISFSALFSKLWRVNRVSDIVIVISQLVLVVI